MSRYRSTRSKRVSSTSLKDLNGLGTVDIGSIKASGTMSEGIALITPDSLPKMPVEQINHPVTFLVGESDEPPPVRSGPSWTYEDENEPFWPNSTLARPHGHVDLMPKITWDIQKINEIVQLCRSQGFKPGSIVAMRPLAGSGNDWKAVSCWHWGMITTLKNYIPGEIVIDFKPLRVKWFNPANHHNIVEEGVFPGQLYLIQQAYEQHEIESIIKDQL